MQTSSPDESIRQAHISTLQVPVRERLDFWRDTIRGPVVPLEFELVDQHPLDASLSWWQIGDLHLSHIQASPHRARRLPANTRLAGMELLVLDIILDGQCYAEQDGRRAVLKPGSAAICNAARSYTLHFPEPCQLAVLTLPRDLLSRQVAAVDRGTAIDLSSNSHLFPLFNAYVKQLISQASSLPQTSSQVIAKHLGELIGSTISENLSQVPLQLSDHKIATLVRVHAYIDANLRNPHLSPEEISRALRVSTRYLNQLLEAEQTSLGRLILRRRLEAAAIALRDPAMTSRSISTLALACGFNNLSHFSKAFRNCHGLSAKEYRAAESDPRKR
ncbi:helix-turn-helix domain-containing protein [Pseudomonas koreensis]|uniref:Helix-turn-helix domain-containing protein n=1 Tax=Pseudomonas koreensis TaxID=198620 RepID=A0A9X2XKQ8_9PSED|nr:helix-turn-helix domain-containing protein [Pseudomonas koreensis]MCU7250900.1 helix-turn-helix domain-containing protein [Pseudomonas koreensis]